MNLNEEKNHVPQGGIELAPSLVRGNKTGITSYS